MRNNETLVFFFSLTNSLLVSLSLSRGVSGGKWCRYCRGSAGVWTSTKGPGTVLEEVEKGLRDPDVTVGGSTGHDRIVREGGPWDSVYNLQDLTVRKNERKNIQYGTTRNSSTGHRGLTLKKSTEIYRDNRSLRKT